MLKNRTVSVLGMCLSLVSFMLSGCVESPPTVSVSKRAIDSDRILIQNVAVFDSRSLQIRPSQDVLVKNGLVHSVAPTGQTLDSKGAYTISGEGATLVPGLYDMHGHLTTTIAPSWEFSLPVPEDYLKGYAYAGVTTIFDPSDSSGDEAYARRDRVERGEIIGPRIFTTGRIITHPEGHPRSLVENLAPWWIRWYLKPKVGTGVESLEAAKAEVDQRVDAGADAIKIVIDQIPFEAPSLEQDLATAIVDHASDRGIRTVAHIGTTIDAIRAAESGISLWVHGVYKERIPDDVIEVLVDYGIPMVTTSEVFDRYGRANAGPIEATKLEREIVAQSILDSFYPIPEDFDLGPLLPWLELMEETITVRRDNVARLHAAGMTILAGSDVQSGVFPGASLHRELATLVEAGLSPAQAIRAATLDPALYLANGAPLDAGVIEAGMRADLLLVEGDPTEDIHALANIREVILAGTLLDRVPVRSRE